MTPQRMIKTFTDRYPFVGPAFWIATAQYFVVQIVVARAWLLPGYSLANNTISDLGNTMCSAYAGRYICSPLHGLMNLSFVVLGITIVVGAVLVYQEFRERASSAVGFSFMALAGLGSILVGLFPENVASAAHLFGAALPFLIGNIGMLVLAVVLDIPRSLRWFTAIAATTSLLALGFLVEHHYLGLGIGGLERIVAYPQTVWFVVFGVYVSHNHMKELRG